MEREGNDVKLLNQKVSESDDNMVTIKHVRKTMEPSLATIPPTNKCRWLCCVWRQHYYSTKLLTFFLSPGEKSFEAVLMYMRETIDEEPDM